MISVSYDESRILACYMFFHPNEVARIYDFEHLDSYKEEYLDENVEIFLETHLPSHKDFEAEERIIKSINFLVRRKNPSLNDVSIAQAIVTEWMNSYRKQDSNLINMLAAKTKRFANDQDISTFSICYWQNIRSEIER